MAIQSMCDVVDAVEEIGIEKGEERVFCLMDKLLEQGRLEDVKKAVEDEDYLAEMMREFDIH